LDCGQVAFRHLLFQNSFVERSLKTGTEGSSHGTSSLRAICNGLASYLGKLVHLGINRAPNKSTLSHAIRHRPALLRFDFKNGSRSSLELAIFFKVKPLAVIDDFTIWARCGAVENRRSRRS
jgi:hypothetical protein